MSEEKKQTFQVDLRGLTCPAPVIATKKLLDKAELKAVEALVDDDVCVNNLSRLAKSLKAGFSYSDRGDYFAVTINKDGGEQTHQIQEPTGAAKADGKTKGKVTTVLFLSRDTLGEGDVEFGRTLLNLFLQTVFDSGQRPQAVLMANSGVKLLASDSQALKVLNDFKSEGIAVLACGLCLDYYKIKEQVPVEQITNMFAICEYLFAADKVLTP